MNVQTVCEPFLIWSLGHYEPEKHSVVTRLGFHPYSGTRATGNMNAYYLSKLSVESYRRAETIGNGIDAIDNKIPQTCNCAGQFIDSFCLTLLTSLVEDELQM